MPQWKSNANTTGAPKWGASILQQGSGAANKAGNNTSLVVNTTPGAFKAHGVALNEVNGIFPVTPGAKANTSGESAKIHGLGWALRTAGEGPVKTITAQNGVFANGETVRFSNGTANGIAVLTTNATGNLASGLVVSGGLFPNASIVATGFDRERHVANLNFANGVGVTLVGVGNGNTINILISNTGNTFATAGVNAVGSLTSNSTGGISNTETQAVAWTGANVGLFSNNQVNTAVVVTFTNANGTVVTYSGGTPTATANLANSSGGSVTVGTTLGGRAGRVNWELLVVDRHINATATTSVANSTILPQ